MGKYLLTCAIAILFILLQTDVIVSVLGKSSSSRSSRKPSKPSHHRPSKPVEHHRPSKPVEHRPSKPVEHRPSKPVHRPVKPVHNQPVHNPAPPQHNPVYPPVNPGKPPSNPGNPPPYNPAYPPQNPGKPPSNPGNPPPYNPAYPPQNPGKPPSNPGNPPPQNPAYPPQNPAYPPRNPGNPPPQNPAYPPQNPGNPAYPPQNPGNPAYPPQNPAYPPHNPGNPPPQNPGYPPQNPGNPVYPPQNPGYPPHNPGNPHNPGYPPQNPGYPHHNPGNPHNPGYPPQNPGYPPNNPGNPHNPGYPQQNPGFPQNPGYPRYGEGGSWGKYDSKPWKPKPPKPSMKHMAGSALAGAAAGAVGGYLLGRAMSNVNFHFNNRDDERWWYENRNRYSDQVYYPQYNQPVPQDIFVRDCTNITVREYTEPSGNQTADEMETRVVTHVVREMCIEQYRTYSSHAGGDFRRPGSRPEGPMLAKPEVKPVAEEAITGAVAKDQLGSSMSNMHLHFNDSDEEQWWSENRNRLTHPVFYPNYSHLVTKDVFASDCENATTNYYIKPTGNQTADEVEARVVTQVAREMCRELYSDFIRHMERSKYDQKPEAPMPTKLWLKHVPEAANIAPGAGATGSNHNSATSRMRDNTFAKTSVLLIMALVTPFLIP
ncbi:cuticle collagen bli-1-like isoform X3 [Podarcis raffonei]|uniref:cuticle collagen bli-1-like isoform X3 n=1 Tax=Podarcis raffonei TaxID=65483 RepID=UPI00232940B0|nr:cuticle collagen bli-1-like isoform X3 [Podarcis raffonei]